MSGWQMFFNLFSWVPNIINESLLFYLEMQTDINDSSLRDIRNAALITWFIMVRTEKPHRRRLPCNTLNNPAFSLFQGILNPMQAFLNTLAFRGWTGFDVDLSLQGRGELAWESISTSVPNAGGHNPMVGSTLLYQSHVQEAKKNSMGNGRHHSDTISVLSEGNWAFSSSNSNDSPVYQGWWSLTQIVSDWMTIYLKLVFSFCWHHRGHNPLRRLSCDWISFSGKVLETTSRKINLRLPDPAVSHALIDFDPRCTELHSSVKSHYA